MSDTNPLIHLWAQHHKGKSKNNNKTTEDSDDYLIDHSALSEAQQLDVSTRKQLLLPKAFESINKNIKLLPKLELCIGSRVMYQNNSDPALGLFNGAMGTVVGFYYLESSDKGKATEKIPKYAIGPYDPFCSNALQAATHQYQLPIVLVQFDERYYKSCQDSWLTDKSRVLPIIPSTVSFKVSGTLIYRTQLPLQLSTCTTIHKCQSLTLDNVVWILSSIFTMGLAYVASSRVRRWDGLYLVPHPTKLSLTTNDINKWNFANIHNEYERLRAAPRAEGRRIADIFVEENNFDPLQDVAVQPNLVETQEKKIGKRKYFRQQQTITQMKSKFTKIATISPKNLSALKRKTPDSIEKQSPKNLSAFIDPKKKTPDSIEKQSVENKKKIKGETVTSSNLSQPTRHQQTRVQSYYGLKKWYMNS